MENDFTYQKNIMYANTTYELNYGIKLQLQIKHRSSKKIIIKQLTGGEFMIWMNLHT